MNNRIETRRYGIAGEKPLTDKEALMNTRAKFISYFEDEPKQLRVSPKSFNDLRAFAERWEYPFGFDVKVDNDMKDDEWLLCIEETKVYAVEIN